MENYGKTAQTTHHVYKSSSTETHHIYLTLKCCLNLREDGRCFPSVDWRLRDKLEQVETDLACVWPAPNGVSWQANFCNARAESRQQGLSPEQQAGRDEWLRWSASVIPLNKLCCLLTVSSHKVKQVDSSSDVSFCIFPLDLSRVTPQSLFVLESYFCIFSRNPQLYDTLVSQHQKCPQPKNLLID